MRYRIFSNKRYKGKAEIYCFNKGKTIEDLAEKKFYFVERKT